MIYFLFACFCVFFMFSRVGIRRVAKHDGVLFPLCQLRRDLINFLHENVFEKPEALSKEEYASMRRLPDAVNATIHNYNEHKTLRFNMRKVARHLATYRTSRQATEIAPQVPDNPAIRRFHEHFGRLLVAAVLAYTPLIRWELALRLIALACRIGKQEEERRRAAEYVIKNAEKVRDDARRYNLAAAV